MCVVLACTAYVKEGSMSVFPNFFFPSRTPFWLRKVTTDPHILAHVNTGCPDERHTKLKIYILELILDS